jgi:hypothetical protein
MPDGERIERRRRIARESYHRCREQKGLPRRGSNPELFIGTGEFVNDGWLSGFIDGEGAFGGHQHRSGAWEPRFTLTQRDDDYALLRRIAAELGGNLYVQKARGASRPVARWHCASKASMLRLVEYLDRFPLRSRKRHEYELWRSAVLIYSAEGRNAPELNDLGHRFVALRDYRGRA